MLNKKALAAAVGVPAQYQIERSLRFNSADSPYLTRTPASAGNRKTWTFSFWYKKAKTGASGNDSIMGVSTGGSTYATMRFGDVSNDVFGFDGDAGAFNIRTVGVFRDVSAWYHFVVSVDTTQATSSNRIKIYVNNVQQTTTGTQPSQNYESLINSANQHDIGNLGSFYNNFYINGYLTEVNFIDGQALTPSSFGETDADTGIWKPKAFSGTYGTNGFYLDFSDNSGTTSTTLGKDYSGNSNNFTPNNFSVTAGTGNDSLVDTPTPYGTDTGVGGEVRGNYCTWNPLDNAGTLANGNLDFSNSGSNNKAVRSTFALTTTEKFYAEFTVTTSSSGSSGIAFGFAKPTATLTNNPANTGQYGLYADSSGYLFSESTFVSSSLGTFSSGTVLQMAYDGATGKAWVGKNNTWYNSSGGTTGDPSAGSNPTFTFTAGEQIFLYSLCYASTGTLNAGQRPFAYTAPSGFKALCTTNLPTPTIGATATTRADDYFNTVLYTGTGATRSITGVGFAPDFVWNKGRDNAVDHCLNDIVRGANKQLVSNTTGAELTYTNQLTSFDSDGFSLGADNLGYTNYNNVTYAAWCWKGGGTGVSNTAGTISSTVSANTTSGFSVATFTAPSSNQSFTVGHGLGVAPKMTIVKRRDSSTGGDWWTWHIGIGDNTTDYVALNRTDAEQTLTAMWGTVGRNSTVCGFNAPNSIVANGTYVMYNFTDVAGFSAFGSYTGNGSSNGPFIYTGFRPAYILVKSSSGSTTDWVILDTKRSTFNVSDAFLAANLSDAEQTDQYVRTDILSNGFKARSPGSFGLNINNTTYIYAAFAENPFKYSLAR